MTFSSAEPQTNANVHFIEIPDVRTLIKIQDGELCSVKSSVVTIHSVDVGQLLALSCHRKRAKKAGS